jgi:NAD(P)-dependent dehydrogenase (short-subunit alcohol dehydrogenase family)
LGTRFCELYAGDYEIVAVHFKNLLKVPSQNQRFTDPLAPADVNAANGSHVYSIRADLNNDQELTRIVELTLARFDRIDLLINAAVNPFKGNIVTSKYLIEGAASQLNLNVIVPLKLSKIIVERFWRDRQEENASENRNIINVSSTAGVYVYPDLGQSVYSASKAAVNYLTYHMASEFWNLGLRVNAVAPNTFPGIVQLDRVAEALSTIDRGDGTGKILVLDRETEFEI